MLKCQQFLLLLPVRFDRVKQQISGSALMLSRAYRRHQETSAYASYEVVVSADKSELQSRLEVSLC